MIHEDPSSGSEILGSEAIRTLYETLVVGMPDFEQRPISVAAVADRVLVRFYFGGTHSGPLLGHPPTGRRIHVEGIAVAHYRQGKIYRMKQSWGHRGIEEELHTIHRGRAASDR